MIVPNSKDELKRALDAFALKHGIEFCVSDGKAEAKLVNPADVAKRMDPAAKAQEFVKGSQLPDNFEFVIDPGYAFTKSYSLRWNAPQETAYPSTFVVGKDGTIDFAVVSKSHGGRADTASVLKALGSEVAE